MPAGSVLHGVFVFAIMLVMRCGRRILLDRVSPTKPVCALMGGHNGGRPRALADDVVAVALEIARAEPLTLSQIARRVEQAQAQALPCKIETLGEALKRTGFTFKRNRFSLKKAQ
jgi:hypothetical protein